jgi:hypothetical protein
LSDFEDDFKWLSDDLPENFTTANFEESLPDLSELGGET